MKSSALLNPDFESLRDTDTIAEATRKMLSSRVTDLPVIDASGKLVGILKLDSVLALLLPKAALIGRGIPDLSFVSSTLDDLRAHMRQIENRLVRELMVQADNVIDPHTPPIEIVLLLYRGAHNIPVVDRSSGKLVGMVAARDVLEALHSGAAP